MASCNILVVCSALILSSCSMYSQTDSVARRLSNIWAIKVGDYSNTRDFGHGSWKETLLARSNDPHHVLLARALAAAIFVEAFAAPLADLKDSLPSGMGPRIKFTIAFHKALVDGGMFPDIAMAQLNAAHGVVLLEGASTDLLIAKKDLTTLAVPESVAQDLVKLELLLNRALTPALAHQVATTEVEIWADTSPDTRIAIEKFGAALPKSLDANPGAAAFMANVTRKLQAAETPELRASRTKVLATFKDMLKAHPDVVKAIAATAVR